MRTTTIDTSHCDPVSGTKRRDPEKGSLKRRDGLFSVVVTVRGKDDETAIDGKGL